ncbi:uncharacterized protein LOC131958450 isoform X2 [Physella acuta]|uniref:uncharacterized protein LOC131958450 isoform X2 n=1 Tax=Physella acuta TaxID=109671 RepID=UPI0027DC0737|nr:uncharacterized protein LOC131958450 isoform X2 [Physella acuta]
MKVQDFGVTGLDFSRRLVAQLWQSRNFKIVYNLTERVGYNIQIPNDNCIKFKMNDSQVYEQCLPKDARLFSPNNSYIGYGLTSLDMDVWEVDLPGGDLTRVAFTTSSPAVPVMSQLFEAGKETQSFLYFNSAESVDPVLFDIPPSCPH